MAILTNRNRSKITHTIMYPQNCTRLGNNMHAQKEYG